VKSFFSDPGELQQLAAQPDFFLRISITFQVMAVTDVSTGHQYAIGSLFESADNEHRVHPPRTHYPNGSQVGRVLQTGNAGQVCACISAPITQKSDNLWFKFGHILTFHKRHIFHSAAL
jgi:hypothetical protein